MNKSLTLEQNSLKSGNAILINEIDEWINIIIIMVNLIVN